MIRRAKPLLGTLVEIAAESLPNQSGEVQLKDKALEAAISVAFSRVTHIGRLLSFHQQDSELNQLNRQPGIWVTLSQDSLRVLKLAKGQGEQQLIQLYRWRRNDVSRRFACLPWYAIVIAR